MESIQTFILHIFSKLQSSSSLRNGLNLCTGDFVDKTKLFPGSYWNGMQFSLFHISFCRFVWFFLVAISSSPLLDIVKKNWSVLKQKRRKLAVLNFQMTHAQRKLLAYSESLENHSWKRKIKNEDYLKNFIVSEII